MNIDDFPAGRDLDAIVAEKVMGWTAFATSTEGDIGRPPEGGGWDRVPAYSNDIAAAWELTTKLKGLYLCDLTGAGPGGEWRAIFTGPGKEWAYASTAPLAICRAALKAVGA